MTASGCDLWSPEMLEDSFLKSRAFLRWLITLHSQSYCAASPRVSHRRLRGGSCSPCLIHRFYFVKPRATSLLDAEMAACIRGWVSGGLCLLLKSTRYPGCIWEWALPAKSFDQVLLWDPDPQKVDGVLNQRLLIMKRGEARDPKCLVSTSSRLAVAQPGSEPPIW